MSELMERIPSRKIMDEGGVVGAAASCESTDEENSMNEGGSKFLSNMTVKDKKLSNIWWKRILNGFINRNGKKQKQQQQAPPLPPRPEFNADSIINVSNDSQAKPAQGNTAKARIRAYTVAVLDLFTPAPTSAPANTTPKRRKRFQWFKK